MPKKSEERKDLHTEDINTENKDIFNAWEDSYKAISNVWGDSYLKLYKPWIESTGEMFEKAVELSKEAIPKVSPFKEIFEPVKNAAKIYSDTFSSISSNWMKSYPI